MRKVLKEAEAESWVPKQPLFGKQLSHSYMDDFVFFFGSTVVPLASYNADLATKSADRILRAFAHELIKLAGRDKINQCGLINLWLDYLALSDYINTTQK
jgi:hypothetical protein